MFELHKDANGYHFKVNGPDEFTLGLLVFALILTLTYCSR